MAVDLRIGDAAMQRMLFTILAGATLMLAAGPAPAAAQARAPASGPLAAVHQFIDNFNKGDAKAAQAAHAPDVVIIDEFPPHVWRGPDAFQAWAADFDKTSKAAGDTDQRVTLGQPIRSEINGDTAYVVVPASYSYKEKGKPIVERAQMAVALRKDGAAWKIAGWAWAGTPPRPAPAAAPPKPK
jgi:ketosteroid isomerase-like protein